MDWVEVALIRTRRVRENPMRLIRWMSFEVIAEQVARFVEFARKHPELTFYVIKMLLSGDHESDTTCDFSFYKLFEGVNYY